jgi:predicted MFS family arabinose efflux permease
VVLTTATFSFVLGVSAVAVPLFAIQSGYSVAEVGLLTAVSAVSQILIRLFLNPILRVFPDWQLIGVSALFLATSCGVLGMSAGLAAFLVSQGFLGVARALFWTGSQTHAVRGQGPTAHGVAVVNLAAAVGTLAGPTFAGFLAGYSTQIALLTAAAVALASSVPTFFMDRLPPFARVEDRAPGRIWRRPGVAAACWAGVTAGTWRVLLSSYVPVVLTLARQSPSTIGILLSLANAASMVGTAGAGRLRTASLPRAFLVGMLTVGVGTAFIGLAAPVTWGAGIALALSGWGAGLLQVVGTTAASDTVRPEERGEAIASTGAFRAVAAFVSPLAAAGMVAVMPLSAVFAVFGVAIAIPAAYGRALRTALQSREPATGPEIEALPTEKQETRQFRDGSCGGPC